MFKLHSTLEADTLFIRELSLSTLLLMNDCRYPWLILVPQKPDITEIYHLNPTERVLLWEETTKVTQWSQQFFQAHKMNVATLGNQIAQLHIHVIGRKLDDEAWPNPVWGQGRKIPYPKEKAKQLVKEADLSFGLFEST